jgi:hypothetical protein
MEARARKAAAAAAAAEKAAAFGEWLACLGCDGGCVHTGWGKDLWSAVNGGGMCAASSIAYCYQQPEQQAALLTGLSTVSASFSPTDTHTPKKEGHGSVALPDTCLARIMTCLADTLEPGGLRGPSAVAADLARAAEVRSRAVGVTHTPSRWRGKGGSG